MYTYYIYIYSVLVAFFGISFVGVGARGERVFRLFFFSSPLGWGCRRKREFYRPSRVEVLEKLLLLLLLLQRTFEGQFDFMMRLPGNFNWRELYEFAKFLNCNIFRLLRDPLVRRKYYQTNRIM